MSFGRWYFHFSFYPPVEPRGRKKNNTKGQLVDKACVAYWPISLLITNVVYLSHPRSLQSRHFPRKNGQGYRFVSAPLWPLGDTNKSHLMSICSPWRYCCGILHVTLTSKNMFSTYKILYFCFISFSVMLRIYICFALQEGHFRNLCVQEKLIVSGF